MASQTGKNHQAYPLSRENSGKVGMIEGMRVRIAITTAEIKKRMTTSDKNSIIVPNLLRDERMHDVLEPSGFIVISGRAIVRHTNTSKVKRQGAGSVA